MLLGLAAAAAAEAVVGPGGGSSDGGGSREGGDSGGGLREARGALGGRGARGRRGAARGAQACGRAQTAPAAMATSGGDDKAFEVVCTGAALRLAKGWLGGAEGEDEDDVVDDSAHIEARQARLGLGAKYLPHNAAVQDPLRRVLGKHAKVRGRARMSQP